MTGAGRFEKVSEQQYIRDTQAYPEALNLQDIPMPARATRGSAGYDLVCPVEMEIAPGERKVMPTGLRVLLRPEWMLMLCPRSSLGRKWGLRLANTVGIVDSDYAEADNEGHILLVLEHSHSETVRIHRGERICQGIFLPVGLTEDDEASAPRRGGYGSTGT